MLARMLLVAPDSTARTRMFGEALAYCGNNLDGDNACVTLLLQRPPALSLAAEAGRLWIAFHDCTEAAINAGGAWCTIRAFAARAAEQAG